MLYINKKNHFIKLSTTLVLFFILSFCNILDCYNFLKLINLNDPIVYPMDTVIYSICGLTTSGRTSFIDVMRFSFPYIIILFITGIYIDDILSDNKKYLYIIRYGNYKNWIKKSFFKLFSIVLVSFFFYYLLIIIISICFSGYQISFSSNMLILYPLFNLNTNCFYLILLQYIISICFQLIMVIVQFILSLYSENSNKHFIYLILSIITLSFIGQFDCYNLLMLSKYNVLNYSLNYNPIITIFIYIIIIFIAIFSMNKIVKSLYRR